MARDSAVSELPTHDESHVKNWLAKRHYHWSDFDVEELARVVKARGYKIIVIIPAKNVADSVGGVIDETVKPLVEAGVVASVIALVTRVGDDRTAEVARAHGASVVYREDVVPEDIGPSLGKGDALWRGLQATGGDIITFLDGDTGDPSPSHLIGIIGPLIMEPEIKMVRACFDRPFKKEGCAAMPHEGGRVTELMARPLLNLHFPALAGFSQPLAGEFAARRSLLEKLAFPVGYGIEVATLIDTLKLEGLYALAQVDVGTRQNAHKSLRDLTTMSYAILSAVEKRIRGNGLGGDNMYIPWKADFVSVLTVERPPIVEYRKTRLLTTDMISASATEDSESTSEDSGSNTDDLISSSEEASSLEGYVLLPFEKNICNTGDGSASNPQSPHGFSFGSTHADDECAVRSELDINEIPPALYGEIPAWVRDANQHLQSAPFIDVVGVNNFRDSGSYATGCGHSVRPKLIYRSAAFSSLTTQGRDQLNALQIKYVFDTRSTVELTQPHKLHGGLTSTIASGSSAEEDVGEGWKKWENEYHTWSDGGLGPLRIHVPVYKDSDFEESVTTTRLRDYAESDPRGFARVYMTIVNQINVGMKTMLEKIAADPGAPFVVHCTAGKDRTGVVIMLLLLLAGCSPLTIAREYALSGPGLARWRPATVERLMNNKSEFLKDNRQASENVTSAREDSMLATIDVFLKKFGSVEEWAHDVAGVEHEVIENARRNLMSV